MAVEPSAWLWIVSLPARRINLRDIINILLTSFSRFVLQVTDPRFFPLIYGPRASRLGHKSTGKNSVRNLQYGPRTQLVRGINTSWSKYRRQMSKFQRVGHNIIPYLTQRSLKILRIFLLDDGECRYLALFYLVVGESTGLLKAKWKMSCLTPKANMWSISEIVDG